MNGSDTILPLLLGVATALVAISVVVIATAVGLHVAAKRRAARRAERMARWRPVVLALMAGDASVHRPSIRPKERRDFLDLLLRYAHAVRGPERQVLAGLAAPYLDAVLGDRAHRDPYRRARAVYVLGRLGLPRHEEAVLESLDDPIPFVALTAAWTLAQAGGGAYAAPVVRAADRFAPWGASVVASVLQALGPAAVPYLVTLFGDPERSVAARVAAAEALRWGSIAEAAAPAAWALRFEREREVLAAALRLLRRLGRPEHAAAARPFARHPDPVLRVHAMSVLAAIGLPEDRPQLRRGLSDPSPWVATRAARGLLELGDRAALEWLAETDHPRALLARQALTE